MIVHKRGSKVKRGHGIFDFIKPILEGVKTIANTPGTSDIIKNSITIGKNTKSIVDALKKKPAVVAPPVVTQVQVPLVETIEPLNSEINEVIARINKLKGGSGCSCQRKISGKGFRYI